MNDGIKAMVEGLGLVTMKPSVLIRKAGIERLYFYRCPKFGNEVLFTVYEGGGFQAYVSDTTLDIKESIDRMSVMMAFS